MHLWTILQEAVLIFFVDGVLEIMKSLVWSPLSQIKLI